MSGSTLLGAASESRKADFHISPNGNDKAPGTLDKPFATVTRARDAVRNLITSGMERDILVSIHGGAYHLKETIVFTLADSASAGQTITYTAAPGEKPVFSAGVAVTGWSQENNNLWSAPLPDGIDSIASLYRDNQRLTRARGPGFMPTVKAKAWFNSDQYSMRFPTGRKWGRGAKIDRNPREMGSVKAPGQTGLEMRMKESNKEQPAI